MSKPSGNLSPEKQFVLDHVERNAKAIGLVGDSIFHFAELGMQEFETAKLMTGLLEKAGFAVERGIAGFPISPAMTRSLCSGTFISLARPLR